MLNKELKDQIMKSLGYSDRGNVLYGMSYMKLKRIIPIGTYIHVKYDEMLPHLFVFEKKGVAVIRLKQGDLKTVENHFFVGWNDMEKLKIKKGLMTYKMSFKYNGKKYRYQLNKFLVIKGNEWLKENAIHLRENNFNQM